MEINIGLLNYILSAMICFFLFLSVLLKSLKNKKISNI